MKLEPQKTHVLHEWKHGRPLIACGFDPTGQYLFSSSEDFTLQRWNVETGKAVSWEAHESWVRDFAFSPDGKVMISAGSDDRLIFWKTDDKQPTKIREVTAHRGWVRAVTVQPSSGIIASAGNDCQVKLWSPDGQPIRTLKNHDSHVYSLYFHPGENRLLSGDLSGKVHQWNVETGQLERTFDAGELHTFNKGQKVHYGGVRDVTLNAGATLLACTGLHKATNPLGAVNEPLVVLFDWATGKKIRSQPADGIRGIGWRTRFLPDSSEVCAAGGAGGGYLLFFRSAEEKPFHQLKLKNTARDMAVHPDGLRIATAHHDGHVRICRMTAPET